MQVEITYGGLTFQVTCYAGNPGQCSGPVESCYPPEPGEIEILFSTADIDCWDTYVEEFGGTIARFSMMSLSETLRAIADDEAHYDAIYALAMETAGDQEQADEDAYWDHKIDEAREDRDD